MKFKTHLRESELEQLKGMARFWGLEPEAPAVLEDRDALADYLYPRMQTPAHFRAAFDKLPGEQREWLYFLALHGGELPVEEMRRRCQFPGAEAMNQAVAELGARGFLWRERLRDKLIGLDLVGIPEPFVRLIDLPPYWQGFLGQHLQALGSDELRAILRSGLDEKPATRKKQALVHYLRRKMLDPRQLKAILAARDSLQLEMFQQILQRNGMCAWKDLLDSGVHKKFDHARADSLRELVEQSGLVFMIRSAPNKYNNLLMVPRDVAWIIQNDYKRDDRTLGDLSRASADAGGRPEVAARPSVILDNSNNILRDLVIVLACVRRGGIKMLNNGGVGRNDLKKIAPLLSLNKTPKYVAFLMLFAITRKLLITVGDQWRVSSTLGQWLARGQACYADLYEFWLHSNEWNEEYIDGDVMHADHYPQNLIPITELRKLVLRMLEKLPSEAWIDFETFAESLMPQIAIEVPGRIDMSQGDKANRHPILIMESVIAETLHWMGIVIIGASDLDTARKLGSRPNEAIAPYDPSHPMSARLIGDAHAAFAFQLTEFGRELMSRPMLDPDKLFAKMPDPAMPLGSLAREITVQPNLEIITPPDLALDTLYQLLAFTDIKKVDIMATLTISRDSVRAGLDTGMSAEAMVGLMRELSRRDLPETVAQMISDCQSRHGEVDMGLAGGYLVVNDQMRLEELRANNKIAPAIKDVFEDKLVLLSRTADFKKIARELQKMGYMPRVDSESLYVTSDGLFQITLQTEELYDLLAMLQFAIMLEQDSEISIFDDRVRPLYQRLSSTAHERFNPKFYAESIAKAFLSNFEKHTKKLVDEATRKYRKQLNRLMSQVPRGRAKKNTFKGENPTSETDQIQKMLKFAIEHEAQVKITYVRASGETTELAIEPEAFQGRKVYALCGDDDEHHLYNIDRIQNASI